MEMKSKRTDDVDQPSSLLFALSETGRIKEEHVTPNNSLLPTAPVGK